MKKITCTNSSEYCSSTTCGVSKTVRQSASLYMSCALKKPVQAVAIRIVLYYKFREFQQFMVDIVVDFCGYMSGKVPSHVLDVVMPVIAPISNINHTCPYEGNVTINNLEIDDRILDNTVLPSGQYRIDLAFLTRKRLIASTQIYVMVPSAIEAKIG